MSYAHYGVAYEAPYSSSSFAEFFVLTAYAGEDVVADSRLKYKLEEGIGKSLLIGAGRFFVESGQGVNQLYLQTSAAMGLVGHEELSKYTVSISREQELYSRTPVGSSISGKVGEIGAGVLLFSVVPGGVGLRGPSLMASGAASGGVVMGLQPVYDGSCSSRVYNISTGALGGAVLAPLVAPAVNATARVVGNVSRRASKGIVKLFDAKRGNVRSVAAECRGAKTPINTETLPKTRNALHDDLVRRGFKFHRETPRDFAQGKGGGIVTYK